MALTAATTTLHCRAVADGASEPEHPSEPEEGEQEDEDAVGADDIEALVLYLEAKSGLCRSGAEALRRKAML